MINQQSMLRGVKAVTPVMLGVAPFGLITGITSVNTGISLGMAVFMSMGIFAGASQLAVLQLISNQAHVLVIIYTALIINLRMMIYSLSIAPRLQQESTGWKALLAYPMTDQSYAISMVRFMNEPKEDSKSFFFGASLVLWCVWQIATVAGYLLGSVIPPELGLDFAIPLTFTAVLFKSVVDWPGVIAVIVSAIVAVTASQLPMNVGLVMAAIAGIAAGALSEKLLQGDREVSDYE